MKTKQRGFLSKKHLTGKYDAFKYYFEIEQTSARDCHVLCKKILTLSYERNNLTVCFHCGGFHYRTIGVRMTLCVYFYICGVSLIHTSFFLLSVHLQTLDASYNINGIQCSAVHDRSRLTVLDAYPYLFRQKNSRSNACPLPLFRYQPVRDNAPMT